MGSKNINLVVENSQSCDFVCAPVLLVGFNRPDFMSSLIAAVRPARPSRLYVAVDGPRADRPNESDLCRHVRDCVKLINWPCEVKTLFREKNLGCKYAVSGAITWFFENEESGIILEDDIKPTLQFMRFASEMLNRYKDDARIGAINGFNFFNLQSNKSESYHFSLHISVWGWASWRRVWREYSVELLGREEAYLAAIEAAPVTTYTRKVYRKFFADVQCGLSTWDIQLAFLFLSKGWLCVEPKERLVINAGIADERATHTGGYVFWGCEWSRIGSVEFPLVHPREVVRDGLADTQREKLEGAILPRGFTWLGSKFAILRRPLAIIENLTMEFRAGSYRS